MQQIYRVLVFSFVYTLHVDCGVEHAVYSRAELFCTVLPVKCSIVSCFLFHYQESHLQINPHGIVAIGPDIDFNAPHNRDTKFS